MRRAMMSRFRLAGVLGAAAIAFGVTGCAASAEEPADVPPPVSSTGAAVELSQDEWDDVVENAVEEGEVVVYANIADAETLFAPFQDAYPEIELVVVREPTADLIGRLDQEIAAGAPGADVAHISSPGWYQANADAGNLAVVQMGPDALAEGWGSEVDVDEHSVRTIAVPLVADYNTDLGESFSTVEEILDDAGDLPVGIAAPTSPLFIEQYLAWEELYGDDFLERLAALNVIEYSSGVPMGQALAAGEIAYALPIGGGVVRELVDQGAPVAEVLPEEGVAGSDMRSAVLASSAHPNAALVFQNWLMLSDTMASLVEMNGLAGVPLDGVPGAIEWDSLRYHDPAVYTTEYQDAFRARWAEIFH